MNAYYSVDSRWMRSYRELRTLLFFEMWQFVFRLDFIDAFNLQVFRSLFVVAVVREGEFATLLLAIVIEC